MADEDRELFEAAMSNEPPAADPAPVEAPQPEGAAPEAPVTPEPRVDATGRHHGEGGKFVPKAPKAEPPQEPAQAAPPEAQQQRSPEPEHRVPLAEHLSEREKRQAAERRAEEFERQLLAMRQQMERPPEPPKTPDIFEDPQGYTQSIEQRFDQRVKQLEANFSFRLAHRHYGQDFDTAYQSLIQEGQKGNRQAVQNVMASADPGEALMRWHRQTTLFEKTGGDLDGFLTKHTDGLLQDEQFLARAAEAIRARANGGNGQPNGQQRPSTVVQLPPSLNRVAAAAPALENGNDDMSDAGLFRQALR